jgi:phytoene dehydrogenase-like protein
LATTSRRTLHLGRTNRWFLGGGKALLNTYFRTAARMGITVRYNASVEDLIIEHDRFEAVKLKNGDTEEIVRGGSVVVASGGYEANIEWLKRQSDVDRDKHKDHSKLCGLPRERTVTKDGRKRVANFIFNPSRCESMGIRLRQFLAQ